MEILKMWQNMPNEWRKNKKYLTEYTGYLLDGSIITGAKFLLDQ